MEIGTRIADRYRIVDIVRQGRKFCICSAIDEALSLPVELKSIQPALLKMDPSWGDVLRSEAGLSRRLRNGHIRAIHRFESRGEFPFLVMEPAAGVSLSEFLRKNGDTAHRGTWFVELARQAVSAVEHIHGRGLLLTDIPLDEVRVRSPLSICLTDLSGLKENTATEESASSDRQPTAFLRLAANLRQAAAGGTAAPQYAVWGSPVLQYRRLRLWDLATEFPVRPRDIATDLHSLGRLLYAMLAGHTNVPEPEYLTAGHADCLPPPSAGADWRPLVAACLRQRSGRRPETATAILRRIDAGSDSQNSPWPSKHDLEANQD